MIIKIPYSPRYPQNEIHKKIESHRFAVVVAHRRTGKTVLAINHLIKLAVKFNKFRDGHFAYVNPFLNQAIRNAWGYLKYYTSVIPGIKIDTQYHAVILPHNNAKIVIYGADNPDSLRGTYFDAIVLDEVAQMKPDVWETIVRPALEDRLGSAVFIGTPKGINLFKDLYDRGLRDESGRWTSMLYDINKTKIFTPQQIEEIKEDMSENSFRQEFLCDWNAEADDILIPLDLISEASQRVYKETEYSHAPVVLGVDVARFGDDSTVIFRRQGLVAFPPVVLKKMDNMEVADRLMSEMQMYKPDAVFVDAGGGAGIIDRVRQVGGSIIEVPFGGKAIDTRYRNRRMEMWAGTKKWLSDGGSVPDLLQLKADLSAPRYFYDNAGKQRLEEKAKIKERLGRSPDLADALALTFAAPVFPQSSTGYEFNRVNQVEYNPLDCWN